MGYTARTDLAVEIREDTDVCEEDGFYEKTGNENGINVTTVKITGDAASKKLGKDKGTYITIDFTGAFSDTELYKSAVACISRNFAALLPQNVTTSLVAGLGNRNLTADSLGPKVLEGLIVTRHLKQYTPELFENLGLGSVAAVATGVLGDTGIESADMIKSACDTVLPGVAILIDALAARDMKRLCSTVQISNTGIHPGSGVGNKRSPLCEKTLGCKVISIGVPTVVDAVTLTADTLKKAGENSEKTEKLLSEYENNLIVTPKDIDVLVTKSAKLISSALNTVLHNGISPDDAAILSEI